MKSLINKIFGLNLSEDKETIRYLKDNIRKYTVLIEGEENLRLRKYLLDQRESCMEKLSQYYKK